MNIINELTLGNQVIIVKSDKQEMVITVTSIHKNKIAYHERPDRLTWVTASNIKTIPITMEWLNTKLRDVSVLEENERDAIINKVKYLHRIQNIAKIFFNTKIEY